MSALASLVHAYDRLAERGEAPVFGYSVEKIGFLISLNEDGTMAGPPIDLRQGEGKKKTPRLMRVPASFKRPGNTPRSFFLWDNTAFVLGVSADEKKSGGTRLAAFRERHIREIADSNDAGLVALLSFINSWQQDDFVRLGWPDEMKDKNVVFALESERRGSGNSIYCIHDRPAALALWARISAAAEKSNAICLITGENAPVARLHPAIKGIRSPGGGKDADSLVSSNIDAFTSYGHEQGDNAPVSEAAAFAYTTALNHFLERDSGHRVQIGDASTVFWADALDAAAAEESEDIFAKLLGVDEKVEAKKVGVILDAIRQGRPIAELKPDLPQGVRFYVLGLSPNAARLSVRFFIEDDFGEIASRYLAHVERMRLDPLPRDNAPSIWRLLIETASQRKSENIPPNLAGEWLRAILTGAPYPLTLLSTLLMRLRADHDINALRAAILKSVLIRNFEMEVPLSLDPKNDDPGYLLGRLFAVLEKTQTLAQGRVNASIKDRYYGAASATPRTVFPLLLRQAAGQSSAGATFFRLPRDDRSRKPARGRDDTRTTLSKGTPMDGDGLYDPIPLSALQHAVYCLRQAALIHIERLWEENRFTAEGRIVHLAADEPGQRYSRGVRRVSAMPLASHRLGLAGVADLVEFHREADGETPFPVEFKRGKAKLHRADEVQLCAQGLCLEEMTGKTVPQGALFYAETRRRVVVPFDDELRRLTEAMAASLREVFVSGRTPPAEYRADKCRACSLLDLCRPRAGARSAKAWREREIRSTLDAVSGEPPP